MPRFLTLTAVAEMTGISRSTLERMINEGLLRAYWVRAHRCLDRDETLAALRSRPVRPRAGATASPRRAGRIGVGGTSAAPHTRPGRL